MIPIKWKVAIALSLTVGVFAGASLLAYRTQASDAAADQKAAAPAPVAKPKTDMEKLQGVWTFFSGASDGKSWDAERQGGFVRMLTITGNTVQWHYGEALLKDGVLKLDPDVEPKTVDISFGNMKYLI